MPRRQANLSFNTSVGSTSITDDLTVENDATIENLTVNGDFSGNVYDRSSALYCLEPLSLTEAGVLYTIPPTGIATVANPIGETSSEERISFEIFGNGVSTDNITLKISKTATPTVDFQVRIETGINGVASGTLADANAVQTIAEGSLTTSLVNTLITFPGSFTLTNNVKYYVVVNQVGDNVDGTNFYNMAGINTSNHLITMETSKFSNPIWAVTNTSFHFVFAGCHQGGIWTNFTTSGVNDHLYVGFPVTAAAAGDSVPFRKNGQITFSVDFMTPWLTYEYSEGTLIESTSETEIMGYATSASTLELIGSGTGVN